MIKNSTTSPVIQIENLQHWFGHGEAKTQILFDNSLKIGRGEMVFLNGPSGSGKTTLLTLIGTLRTVQAGNVKILDQDLRRLNSFSVKKLRKKIGFIFQAHNLFDSLTAFQNVRMATDLIGMPRKQAKPKIEKLLTRLGLGKRMNYKPRALSGGQKQRVAIARALIHNPQLVLADEPTAALDSTSGRDVVELFREMSDTAGCTFMIVTHDNRILDVADRIVNMVGGRITTDADLRQTEAICEFLRQSELFKHLTPRTLTELAPHASERDYQAGETIVAEGDAGEEFFMIASGRVEVRKAKGETFIAITQLSSGEHFGEVSILESQPRNASVVAIEPTKCYIFDRVSFQAVLDASDSFSAELRKAVFERS